MPVTVPTIATPVITIVNQLVTTVILITQIIIVKMVQPALGLTRITIAVPVVSMILLVPATATPMAIMATVNCMGIMAPAGIMPLVIPLPVRPMVIMVLAVSLAVAPSAIVALALLSGATMVVLSGVSSNGCHHMLLVLRGYSIGHREKLR